MTKISIETIAAQLVEIAGSAGGSDEVKLLAERGWPAKRPLEIVRLDSRDYEDDDDCRQAALNDVAEQLGVETWELSADWEAPYTREEIVVFADSLDLRRRINAAVAAEVSR